MEKYTIKKYLTWIVFTYDNLVVYDDYFNRSVQREIKECGSTFVTPDVQNYAQWYITPYLLINIFEFFKLFWKFKYSKDPKQCISEAVLKGTLLSNFSIDYTSELPDIKEKVLNCPIFREKLPLAPGQSTSQTYYETIRLARNAVSHANFHTKLAELVAGLDIMDTTIDFIRYIIR